MNKVKLGLSMLVFLTVLTMVSGVLAGQEVKVFVDNEEINFPDQNPYIDQNNRTQVPVRFVSQALGGYVEWHSDSQEIEIKLGDDRLILEVGIQNYSLNGQALDMDTAPLITNQGRTMVPLRFVSEGLGAQVNWVEEENSVYISQRENNHQIEDLEQAEVTATTLNVRTGPGLNHAPIHQVHANETYPVLEEVSYEYDNTHHEWMKINLPEHNEVGWVSRDFVRLADDNDGVTEDTNKQEGHEGSPLQGFKIVIDPGHGGTDPGAVGPTGLTEKEVALDVSLRARDLLEDLGAETYLTRYSDIDVTLYDRINLANQINADIFISVHANAALNRSAQGTETYYSSQRSLYDYNLANSLQTALVNKLGTIDRGTLDRSFYVLRHGNMPSALVELAFVSNYWEESLLKDNYFRQNAAQAITDGVYNYFKSISQSY
ncbi:N-acetylmuramoyl-L-alanine amidase [Natranaerobius thermophilus]|uniref:N-acetylmuramoyl-L-alanine amidase n=1 Tax=Natranaerobius thermophilus (strain ATCC BAA-1301 / DSM 18059 / JW/NM-WN-LF) TaxID=457570 RepID=B2A7X7_NATTJ|nr:N-acetylmuramoyl-L-alanine amidase [Natranaerobius thermophilus]ACB85749.1 N-acetylmuramoyl-L-alanine amidase [Natranaerobius thermophilus JW/NM-WN-LF]